MARKSQRSSRRSTSSSSSPAAEDALEPSEALADLVGAEARPLDELVDGILALDLMQMPDEVLESPLGERLAQLELPPERHLVAKIVRDFAKPALQSKGAAPSRAKWLGGAASDIEVLCPGVTALLRQAAALSGAKEPGAFIDGLKEESLGELCEAGDALLEGLAFVRQDRERVIDVTVRLRVALKLLRTPLTPAQIKARIAEYKRRGAELARRFLTEEV